MNTSFVDTLTGVDKLDKAQADGASGRGFVVACEVQVVVMLHFGAHHDLVDQVIAPVVLEVNGHHGAQRRRVVHLHEDAATRDIPSDGPGVADGDGLGVDDGCGVAPLATISGR